MTAQQVSSLHTLLPPSLKIPPTARRSSLSPQHMDSYSSLLDRTRAPHLSLQKFAVISIFEKLRSSPPPLNPDSDPGRDAVTQCLRSASPAVVDQSVRELCRLVKDSKLDLSRALLELQSVLEGCESRFVDVFVKGLGFLVRYGFRQDSSSFRFPSAETHPFVKVRLESNQRRGKLFKARDVMVPQIFFYHSGHHYTLWWKPHVKKSLGHRHVVPGA